MWTTSDIGWIISPTAPFCSGLVIARQRVESPEEIAHDRSATVSGSRQRADYVGTIHGTCGGRDALLNPESVLEKMNLVRLEPQNGIQI
jgi:hypothetical protein